ncbi:MAG: alpha/beta hydrolase, partial [Spirochaetota bacterium]
MNRTHVISSGASFFFQSSGNRAVLGLHGYTGYPHDLRHIASVLHAEGYAVHVPRLPGHATNAADFLKSSAHDWLTRAYNAYLDLCVTYEEVHVLGFSMGGLLALLLAARCDIEKLILIAPALSVRDKNIRYTPLLWPFLHKIRNNPVFNGSSADQKIMYEEYWKWSYIKNVAQ